ncbi:VOC family protein [Streptomyces sp. Y7]|uniref:VOC family protein n=1 Tax=Streptomyces sp. Y7 TaxID=3342392 RepID=UPI00371409A6
MSILFGGVRQNGYIVEDLDAALQHWVKAVGAGPFFVARHLPLEYFTFQGSSRIPDLSVALGNVGDLQIELVHQHDDAPSPYLYFRQHKGAGLQHISSWSRAYDDDLARLRERGIVPECEGKIVGAPRFAYFGTDALDGSCYEMSDLGPDNEYGVVHDLIREAAVDWDGSDPIRDMVLPPEQGSAA